MERRAKIVATLGPASGNEPVLRELLVAGVDVVRLNLSHGSHREHGHLIDLVRRLSAAEGRHVPVIADLMGPRFRLGVVAPERSLLADGARVTLGDSAHGADLPIDEPGFLRHLETGERILIDHGLVELRVLEKRPPLLVAEVLHGGPVGTRKGINLPDTTLPFEVSPKDRADLAFAVERGVDYLAASYVGAAADLRALRALVREAATSSGTKGDAATPLIAKLERGKALDNLDEIVAEADALMVARGDLGVEVPLHQVPVLQKRIVAAGRRAGKPVIVATQMLESMIEHPRPTRAESSDVANAVLDGTDAVMLSGETAAGRWPVEAVETMAAIITTAEDYARGDRGRGTEAGAAGGRPGGGEFAFAAGFERIEMGPIPKPEDRDHEPAGAFDIPDVISAAAVYAAERLQARAVVAYSQGGFTARLVARYRPVAPILAVTNEDRIARRVQLLWGVRPLVLDSQVEHSDEVVKVVEKRLLETGAARAGDCIIVLMGAPIRDRPLTNLLRAHRLG